MTEKEYLQNLAERLWLNEDDITNIINCYIQAITGKFVPLSPYPKPRIDIRPVKIKSLKEKLEEVRDDRRRTS